MWTGFFEILKMMGVEVDMLIIILLGELMVIVLVSGSMLCVFILEGDTLVWVLDEVFILVVMVI